jgi:PAS domain S-box-containing protein
MNTQPRRFLLITSSQQDRARIQAVLETDPKLANFTLESASDATTLKHLLGCDGEAGEPPDRYDMVLCEAGIEGMNASTLFECVQRALPDTPIVLIAGEEDIPQVAPFASEIAAPVVLKGDTYLPLLPGAIHARLQAERALTQSEARFERLAENAPDMIFRWSYANGFEYVSPASTEIFGFTPEEHYADPGLGYRRIHTDDLAVYESVFAAFGEPEGPQRYCVVRWHHKEGHLVHVEFRLTPIYDEHGNLTAIEGIARDISQHVRSRKRLRELTARLTQAHEEERRHLARELHDEVGQALTIAKMRMRMVENALPEDATDAREKIALLESLVKDTLEDVRTLSHELRPPLLEEMGWGPALKTLCDSFSDRTGLPIRFTAGGGDARLAPEIELTAYRVVQEALTNVARHAEATQATVRARLLKHGLEIIIEDNGEGFEMEAIMQADAPNLGLGLLSMRERVDAVGGQITIDSVPGWSTRIHLYLPREELD